MVLREWEYVLANAKDNPHVASLRGSAEANTLLIAPPLMPDDLSHGLPFSDERGRIFHSYMQDAGFDTEKDMLVISCTGYHIPKTTKKNTEAVRAMVFNLTRSGFFKRVICVGHTAFTFILGDFLKTSSSSLIGTVLHPKSANHLPVLVFPNLDCFVVPSENLSRRDWRLNQMWIEKTTQTMERMVPVLKKFMA